jgi:bisphosphoglycerate-dependent phosphoglycerate mutase
MVDKSMKSPVRPATRLVLVRHGESQVTVDRVIGGYRTCSGLSELGREQSGRLRDRLSNTGELEGGVLIASNFSRALETARIFGPAMGTAEPIQIAGFGEHDPGPELRTSKSLGHRTSVATRTSMSFRVARLSQRSICALGRLFRKYSTSRPES